MFPFFPTVCLGKSTGNHGFYHEIWGFPVNIFPNKPTHFSIDLSSSGGAGVFAGYSDEAYEQKGCTVTSRGDTIDKSEAIGSDGGWRMTIRPLKGWNPSGFR